MEPLLFSDVARTRRRFRLSPSHLPPESEVAFMMSLVSEYRQLAAASLDLAKRAAVRADKMRLLVMAEAWLNLANRVAKKTGPATRWSSTEYPKTAERADVVSTLPHEEATTVSRSPSHGRYARDARGSTPTRK